MEKIEEKLRALATLQSIDSKLDHILTLRGSLPDEVADLEDDIAGLESRRDKIDADIKAIEAEVTKKQNGIKDFSAQIKKYETQLNTVKNNREYEALSKEIEYAQLEILTSEKKIKQLREQIDGRKVLFDETQKQIDERQIDLGEKRKELDVIVKETEREEKKLRDLSDEASVKVEDHILKAYRKIRRNMRNGLAVVPAEREACGGCFSIIPPKVQLEMRSRKKFIICENCGRILVDQSFFGESEAATVEASEA